MQKIRTSVHRRKLLALIFLLALSLYPSSKATVIAGPIINPSNNHTYYLLSPESWPAAQVEAETLGGNLATVRDQTENDWLFNTFGGLASSSDLWIGLYDPTGIQGDDGGGSQHAADFVWISGEAISYLNWSPGEPNNWENTGEYYTEIVVEVNGTLIPGMWNDVPAFGDPYIP